MYIMRKKRKLDVSKKEPVEPLKQNINLLNIDGTDVSIFSQETKNTKTESSNDPKENKNIENELINLKEKERVDMETIIDVICSKGVPEKFRVLLQSQLSME